MTTSTMNYMSLNLEMPWDKDEVQEEKFQRLLKKTLIAMLVLFVVIPWLPVFAPDYEQPEETIIKTKVLLDPPVVERKPTPKPKPKVKPATVKPAMTAKPKSTSRSAASSLAALSSQFSGLSSSVDVARMQRKNVSDSRLGKVTRSSRTVLGEESVVKRRDAIQIDDTMTSSGAVALSSHQSADVDSPIGYGGSGGPVNQRGYSSNMEGRRDMESIRRIFERQKGSVYALYTKALRNYPDLNGKFLFELIIEADGTVSNLQLVNSELGMDDLERRILARIQNINFGVADVSPTSVQYKFVFLPS